MVIQVPVSKASIKQNQLEFTLPGEKKSVWVPKVQYTLAHFRDRITGFSMAARSYLDDVKADVERDPTQVELEALQGLQAVRTEMFMEYWPHEVLVKLTSDQMEFIFQQWNEQSKVSVGE